MERAFPEGGPAVGWLIIIFTDMDSVSQLISEPANVRIIADSETHRIQLSCIKVKDNKKEGKINRIKFN